MRSLGVRGSGSVLLVGKASHRCHAVVALVERRVRTASSLTSVVKGVEVALELGPGLCRQTVGRVAGMDAAYA